jgi:di/tricarboxylate transporter
VAGYLCVRPARRGARTDHHPEPADHRDHGDRSLSGIAVWSVWFADRRHGGLVLIGLSIVLLLVGGGFGPPLIGVLVGITAIGMGRPPPRAVTPASRLLSRLYPWPLVVTVLALLGLAPGTVLLRHFVVVAAFRGCCGISWLLRHFVGLDETLLVIVLVVTAFASLFLALITARARDRRPESTGPPAETPGR